MRYTFASLLLQEGAPITYFSQQLGRRDPSITLRVYAHWLADASSDTLVNRLDDTASDVTEASPATSDEEVQRGLSRLGSEVSKVRLRAVRKASRAAVDNLRTGLPTVAPRVRWQARAKVGEANLRQLEPDPRMAEAQVKS